MEINPIRSKNIKFEINKLHQEKFTVSNMVSSSATQEIHLSPFIFYQPTDYGYQLLQNLEEIQQLLLKGEKDPLQNIVLSLNEDNENDAELNEIINWIKVRAAVAIAKIGTIIAEET